LAIAKGSRKAILQENKMLSSYCPKDFNDEQYLVRINYSGTTPIEFVVERAYPNKRQVGDSLQPNERVALNFPDQVLKAVSIKPLTQLTNQAIIKELRVVEHSGPIDSAIAVVVFPDGIIIGIEAHSLYDLVVPVDAIVGAA
jgi:hypothetical protein